MHPLALLATDVALPIGLVGGVVLLVSLLLTVGWLLYLYR
jgi:hypothetical protein